MSGGVSCRELLFLPCPVRGPHVQSGILLLDFRNSKSLAGGIAVSGAAHEVLTSQRRDAVPFTD